jgi:hypothetical protein
MKKGVGGGINGMGQWEGHGGLFDIARDNQITSYI